MRAPTARDFAEAARAVIDMDAPNGDRYVLLAALADRARRDAVPFAREAMWGVARYFLTGEPEPEALPGPDPVNAHLRYMRRQGYGRCPTCHREIPPQATLEHWDALARDALRAELVRPGRSSS